LQVLIAETPMRQLSPPDVGCRARAVSGCLPAPACLSRDPANAPVLARICCHVFISRFCTIARAELPYAARDCCCSSVASACTACRYLLPVPSPSLEIIYTNMLKSKTCPFKFLTAVSFEAPSDRGARTKQRARACEDDNRAHYDREMACQYDKDFEK